MEENSKLEKVIRKKKKKMILNTNEQSLLNKLDEHNFTRIAKTIGIPDREIKGDSENIFNLIMNSEYGDIVKTYLLNNYDPTKDKDTIAEEIETLIINLLPNEIADESEVLAEEIKKMKNLTKTQNKTSGSKIGSTIKNIVLSPLRFNITPTDSKKQEVLYADYHILLVYQKDDDLSDIEDEEGNNSGGGISGKDGLWDDQIEEYMQPFKKYGWKGVYSINELNEIPVSKKMSFIMNLSPDYKEGTHLY
jgi:hypothetical protein